MARLARKTGDMCRDPIWLERPEWVYSVYLGGPVIKLVHPPIVRLLDILSRVPGTRWGIEHAVERVKRNSDKYSRKELKDLKKNLKGDWIRQFRNDLEKLYSDMARP